MPRSESAREEILSHAFDVGRGASAEDQFAEPGGRERNPRAIAKGAQAVVDGTLDSKQAGLLGYYLQLALSNVGRVDFEDDWEAVEG